MSRLNPDMRRKLELGKCLGLYANNDEDIISTLVDLHMEKEDGTKWARARGKRGRNRRQNVCDPLL